jgi:hypothetical protein
MWGFFVDRRSQNDNRRFGGFDNHPRCVIIPFQPSITSRRGSCRHLRTGPAGDDTRCMVTIRMKSKRPACPAIRKVNRWEGIYKRV